MRYTVGAIGQTKLGNFIIETREDYALFPTIDITINWRHEKNGFFGKRNVSKVVYKARVSNRNLELARALVQEKVNEKLPILIKMEQEGRL